MKLLSTPSFALLFALALPAAAPLVAQTDAPSAPASQTDGPPTSQEGGPRRGGPEHHLEMLQKNLSLTSEQTAQVKSIFDAERGKMDALRSNSSLSQEDRRTQMMAIHQDESTKIRALLTSDQAARFDAMEARMRQHRPGTSEGAPPPPAGPDGGGV